MRKVKKRTFLLAAVLILVLSIMPLKALPVKADDNADENAAADILVTATTSASVKQGYSGYCYVYIDSLEVLSTLSVTVHYDADKVNVKSGYAYNVASALLSDKSVNNSSVQFSYIFDGNGKAEKTQLFYFRYTVLSNAEVGDTYFDVVVNEAYDSSLQPVSVSGSRCAFAIAETVTTKTCYIYSSSLVNTSVAEEFQISYRLSTYEIASGSFVINYDPELFEVVNVNNGTFLGNKISDVNVSLSGSIYVSFVGTEYNYGYDLLKVKFKTLKNVTEKSTIKLTVTEFYDLELNPISCRGYTTNANVEFDETYTADAPCMALQTAYNSTTDKVTLTVTLEENSMLGAGDFVLNFNKDYLIYDSAQKGFAPTFFNVNDKNVNDGVLKFSIISLSDITDAQTVLTVIFDVKHACEDKLVDFEISGSGFTDSLTNSILLNLVDTSVTVPLKHTAADAVEENRTEATCENDGGYDLVVYCSNCGEKISSEHKTIAALGHKYSNYVSNNDATCTKDGTKTAYCEHGCGKTDTITDKGSAIGHDYGEVSYLWAEDYSTCTAKRICKHDESHQETETVNSSATVVQESTCVLDELSTYSVTFENLAFKKQTVEKVKTADALGHKRAVAVEENIVKETCENDGSYDLVVYCSTCGEELTREHKTIVALGHDYCEWYATKNATCTKDGEKRRDCKNCEHYETDVVEAQGHVKSDWIIDKEATYSENGFKHKECTICGETLAAEIINKLEDENETSSIASNESTQSSNVVVQVSCGSSVNGYSSIGLIATAVLVAFIIKRKMHT